MVTCKVCKIEFLGRSNQLFCGSKCRSNFHANKEKVSLICVVCGKNNVNKSGYMYCSVMCYRKSLRAKIFVGKNECNFCKKSFTVNTRSQNQKFCNHSCYINSVKRDKLERSKEKLVPRLDPKNVQSLRWEVLWKLRPDLHKLMQQIEKRLPII